MRQLHEQNATSIFLFQDDDFPVWGQFGRRWVEQFNASLRAAELRGRVLWKISCRSDEVEPLLFAYLRDAGLYVVYLGIESGNPTGLETLNKKLNVEDNLRAVAILKELGLAFTYGFMLFDPSSTFDSLKANVRFLRELTVDGWAPVVFCRMLPYAGTPIESRLKRERRLCGSVDNPSYDFLDRRISLLFDVLNGITANWIQGSDSLANQINFAWQEYWVLRRLTPAVKVEDYEQFLRSITAAYNEYLLRLVENVISSFELGDRKVPSPEEATGVAGRFSQSLVRGRDAFVMQNQLAMIESLAAA